MILKFEFGETKHLHEVQNTAAMFLEVSAKQLGSGYAYNTLLRLPLLSYIDC